MTLPFWIKRYVDQTSPDALPQTLAVAQQWQQMKAQDRAFDPDRYFCETQELMHVGGRTYAATNQWGASTQEIVDALLTAFGNHGVTIEAANG